MDGSDDNGLHGAQNELEAEKEIQYFFPKEQTVAVIKPNSVDQKGLYKCMYAYLYVCVYVCMYVYVWMYVFMYVYICIYMYICMYVWMYVCIYVSTYMYVCMYVCTSVHTYTLYIHIQCICEFILSQYELIIN